ncbi:hypothetical protein L3X38_036340 [Prunus dulcis]|uniref:Uncharacterized protein n=1 Tax=Prunus dulcis TaxID=3755 RepID=A0AAD4V2D1_PRUDU|nr:hypothetical protein L3X38_036340 [Prunus dulcis]
MSESIYVDDDSPYESVPETQALPQTSNPRQRPIGQKKKLMSSLGVVSNFKLGQVVPNPSQVSAPASNSLNFGVPTNPKPVSSQKVSHYIDARCAI